ncbi:MULTISPECIES: hypothetical protein [unclassified Flavobacterium]|uniref:hypothetical protein n=1 Tax=unclassified Flavobacterium TaxID=196869 RepID=UPI001F148ECB|nr:MULTISPECIES: hypothetical protein [unclassified Flavobacterium]UMY65056.1 hypothetical protein MKO97_11090 [Flavobacterium sp. HJ-32-4]
MKKSVIFLLLVAASVTAQSAKKQLTQSVCDCINAEKTDLTKTDRQDLERKFGQCFILAYGKLNEKQQQELNVNFDDSKEAKKFGMTIAVEMASLCPDVLLAVGMNIKDENGSISSDDGSGAVEDGTETEEPDPTMTCKVVELQKGQFVSLLVKDTKGRSHTLLFLWDFGAVSLITDNQLKKNDNIEVSYSELEFYDPILKDFRTYKVISGLRKL